MSGWRRWSRGARWTLGLGVASCLCLHAGANAEAITAEEVRLLREQVEILSQRLSEVEAELEARRGASSAAEGSPAPPSSTAAPAETAAPSAPRVRVDERGVFLQSQDEAFQLRIRTRLAFEFGWFDQDDALKYAVGDEQDGVGFPYARLYLMGKVFRDFDYVFEVDFAGQDSSDSPKFRDMWIGYSGIPSLFDSEMALRIGNFREPFSLETLGGNFDRSFTELSLLRTFAPGRNAGVELSGAWLGEPGRERMSWAAGIFKETDDLPSSNDSDERQGWQTTGRVTGLPYYADEGRRLLHLGAAYSYRTPKGALVRYGVRPEAGLSQFRYVDTEGLPEWFRLSDARVEEVRLLGLEAAGVWGPASLQAEYAHAAVRTTLGGDLGFDSWYVMGSYFLTGEHRRYNHGEGIFALPAVKRPFAWRRGERGPGAWELTARHSFADLNDGPIQAGEQRATTLGVNWYLNRNVRTILNFTRNKIEHPLYEGRMESLTLRLALDF